MESGQEFCEFCSTRFDEELPPSSNIEELLSIRDLFGQTPLIFAAGCCSAKCVEALIKLGADVNALGNGGYTALIRASRYGLHDRVELLLKAGADVNIKHKHLGYKRNALMEACNAYPASQGHDQCVKALITVGADVNIKHKHLGYKRNALMEACNAYPASQGHDQCVKALITAGADVNEADEHGYTPLLYASEDGRVKCVEILIKAGADVNKRNEANETALISAAYEGHDRCDWSLLRSGAKINFKINFQVNYPRYLAALNGLNALGLYLDQSQKSENKNIVMLLYAAGETIILKNDEIQVPDYLKLEHLKLNLKHLCRETIRKHLLDTDPHQQMFGRIPQLGLPSLLNSYLLYNMVWDDGTKESKYEEEI